MMPFWQADALLRDQGCESAKVSSIDDNVQINLPIFHPAHDERQTLKGVEQ